MKRMLTVLAAVISAAVSFTAQADGVQLPIIHKPAQAIANASAAGANPYTDANGATWGCFTHYIPAATGIDAKNRTLESFTHASSGLPGFKNPDYTYPYVLANNTDHAAADSGDYSYVSAGALCFQPSPDHVGVYFQAPRNGFYDVDARFGRVQVWKGHVDVSIVLDGAMLFLEDLNKETDGGARPVYSSVFTQKRLFLKAGQRLEFMVGRGISEGLESSDLTSLELTIAEVEDVSGETVLIDVGKAMAENMRATTPVNPWSDSSGAQMSIYRAGFNFRFDQIGNSQLQTVLHSYAGGIYGFKNDASVLNCK